MSNFKYRCDINKKKILKAIKNHESYDALEKCYERDNKLYKKSKELKEYEVAKNPQRDDFGLYEYVDQYCGYCEDDYYGTIYTKTPFKNRWLKRVYHC